MERTNISTNQKYLESLAIEAFGSDGYFTINKQLASSIGILPSALLGLYLDRYKYFKNKYPENNGWFYITHEVIMKQFCLSEFTVRKTKGYLQNELGIIQTKMSGQPAKEYIKINFIALISNVGLNLSETKPLDLSKTKGLIKEPIIKDKKEIYKEKSNDFLNSDLQPINKNKLYLPIAKDLADIITSKKKIRILPKTIPSWADEIRKLVTENQIPIKRVTTALEWYKENIGGNYVPVIESGKSLREKFLKLEAAIKRDDTPEETKPPKYFDNMAYDYDPKRKWWFNRGNGDRY